jgi:hypothetical protein
MEDQHSLRLEIHIVQIDGLCVSAVNDAITNRTNDLV